MEKSELVEILLALEEKYYHLMEVAKDEFDRGQYFAMVAAYSKAARIICSEEYAEQIKKELE